MITIAKKLKSFHNGSYANAIKRIIARKTKDLILLVGPPQEGPWVFKSDIVIRLEEDCEYSTENDGTIFCDHAAYPCDMIDKTRYCKRNKRKEDNDDK